MSFGGLAKQMPIYTGFVTVAFFAAIGLPGLSGFISEALVFLGGFGNGTTRILQSFQLLEFCWVQHICCGHCKEFILEH